MVYCTLFPSTQSQSCSRSRFASAFMALLDRRSYSSCSPCAKLGPRRATHRTQPFPRVNKPTRLLSVAQFLFTTGQFYIHPHRLHCVNKLTVLFIRTHTHTYRHTYIHTYLYTHLYSLFSVLKGPIQKGTKSDKGAK